MKNFILGLVALTSISAFANQVRYETPFSLKLVVSSQSNQYTYVSGILTALVDSETGSIERARINISGFDRAKIPSGHGFEWLTVGGMSIDSFWSSDLDIESLSASKFQRNTKRRDVKKACQNKDARSTVLLKPQISISKKMLADILANYGQHNFPFYRQENEIFLQTSKSPDLFELGSTYSFVNDSPGGDLAGMTIRAGNADNLCLL